MKTTRRDFLKQSLTVGYGSITTPTIVCASIPIYNNDA
jgi:hypothetical protein